MPRSRSIKPGFFKNETLAECGPAAMLMFAGLWTLADRAGRLEDRPKRIKAEIFPYWPDMDADAVLQNLADAGFIIRYKVNCHSYIAIPTWDKHQNPHVKEAASTIPAPGENDTSPVQAPEIPERAGLTPSFLTPDSPFPVKPNNAPVGACVRKPSRRDRTLEEVRRDLGIRLPWFEALCSVHPMGRDGVKAAAMAFERHITADEAGHARAQEMYRAAKAYADRCRADPTAKVKWMQGWINDERWRDENKLPAVIPSRSRSIVENVEMVIGRNLAETGEPW